MSQQPQPPQSTSQSSSSVSTSTTSSPVGNGQPTHYSSPWSLTSGDGAAAAVADGVLHNTTNNNNNHNHGAAMMTSMSRHPASHIDEVLLAEQSTLPVNAVGAAPAATEPVKREETPFSLKHFLKRNPSTTTSSTTSATTSPPTSASTASSQPHRSTGARPKVPLNSASSAYNFHTMTSTSVTTTGGPSVPNSSSYEATGTTHTARMKRSPKFSSFDSQASLAEFSTSSPSSTSLPANATAVTTAAARGSSSSSRNNSGGGGHWQQQQQQQQQHHRYDMFGYSASPGATAARRRTDDDVQMSPTSPSTPEVGAAGAGVFQRSFSTFDIGGGGKRYNIGQRSQQQQYSHSGRLDTFARATSMQGHHVIHDNDVDDDDDDDDDVIDEVSRVGDAFLDSPTRRALRAAAGGLGTLSPDISAALPDFVQDHILVEHLYGAGVVSGATGGGPQHQQQPQQLPDFTQNADSPSSAAASRTNRLGSATGNMPFDLMCSPGGGCEAAAAAAAAASQQRRGRNAPTLPLDLPFFGNSVGRQRSTIYHDIPVDLTARNDSGLPLVTNGIDDNVEGASSYADLQAGALRTLPDFLADGHMHASVSASNSACAPTAAALPQSADAEVAAPCVAQPSSPSASSLASSPTIVDTLRAENTRLRSELQHSQQSLFTQQRRCDELAAAAAQANQTRRAEAMLPTAIEMEQSALITQLQRQLLEMTDNVEALRKENAILKEDGAVGGDTHSISPTPHVSLAAGHRVIEQSQELSRDMMQAAASAESNLRQLLSGVDNLRLMARRIESLADVVDLDAASPSSASAAVHSPTTADYED